MKASRKVKVESLAEKALRCLREKELGARHYKRSDALLQEIVQEIDPGQPIKVGEHDTIVVSDNFAGGKTQFFHGSFARRFELERVRA